jgi:hypothetical protein
VENDLSILAADNMKPVKLKLHLETKHSEMKNKHEEHLLKFASSKRILLVSCKALLASYQVSYRTARNKKPHTIAETVVLPAAADMIQTTFGGKCDQRLRNVPLTNNAVSQWFADISEGKIKPFFTTD